MQPYVIDANKKLINEPKIIRPLDEQVEEEKVEDIRNEEVLNDALDKAKQLHDDAIERATQIRNDALAEAEEIKKNAYNEGYDKGLSDGNMEAMKRADEYLANITREQDAIIAGEREKMQESIRDTERKLVDFSCSMIEKITGMLLTDYKPVLIHMINSALRDADTSKYFIIKVSEQNYSYVSDNTDSLVGAANPGISIEVYGDAALTDKQCVIETENGIIDLSLDVQIRNLVLAIKMLSE